MRFIFTVILFLLIAVIQLVWAPIWVIKELVVKSWHIAQHITYNYDRGDF